MEKDVENQIRENQTETVRTEVTEVDEIKSDLPTTEVKEEQSDNQSKKQRIKQFFSARKIATLAMFTALAFVVSLFDFPVFPQASFLKLDFSNVFVMLMGFVFGPVEAVIVCVIKELIHIPMGTTGGVGELANILMGVAYALIPSTVYYFKKGIAVVIPTLVAGTVLQTAVALLCNRYITFPLYMGSAAANAFNSLYSFIIFFNLIKGAAVSVICIVLYKYLSKVLKKLKIK